MCLLFIGLSEVNAQFFIPNGKIAKKTKEHIKVRWEPSTMEEWKLSKTLGYEVKLYEVSNGSRSKLIESTKVKQLPYNDWDIFISRVSPFKQQFYRGARNQIYPENLTSEEEKISSVYKGQTSDGLDSIMLGLLIYSATYDFNLARLTGLGASFKNTNVADFEIEITCGTYKHIVKNPNKKNELPNLTGEWGDRVVKLKWPTVGFEKDYFGYIIDKSEDGLRFKMKDSLPYTNFTFGNIPNDVTEIESLDSLDENNKMYYFRLRGMDYFGDYTTIHSSITGFGAEQLTLSPFIIFADQTEDNQAHLKWDIDPKQMRALKDFTIYRTDTIGGNYEVAIPSLPASAREVKIPMTFTINYYRIEANPRQGKSLSSMPVFVMGQDTIPPARPEIISATADKKGIVNILWKNNTEPDFWGYRVYISNFKEDEYSLLTEYPTTDTVFVDTINLKMGLENIYYLVQSTDKRNNMSPFTDTIRLQLPDILPPAPPVLLNLKQYNDTIRVQWVNSPAKDLKEQYLYRREVKGNTSWAKIAIIDSTNITLNYNDAGLTYGVHYAYTMVAVDKTGLESVPDQYLDWLLEKPKEKFIPFQKVAYELNEKEKKVVLSWNVNAPEKYKHVTVYRGTDKNKMGKYKIIDGPNMELTDSYTPGTVLYYRLKPAFSEQTETYFSDYIEVVSSSEPSKSK